MCGGGRKRSQIDMGRMEMAAAEQQQNSSDFFFFIIIMLADKHTHVCLGIKQKKMWERNLRQIKQKRHIFFSM